MGQGSSSSPTLYPVDPPTLSGFTLSPVSSTTVPPGWVVGLDSSLLSDRLNNDALDSWGVYTAFGSPIYHSSGGGSGGFSPYVSFDRSGSQYIDLGGLSLAIKSNGGLTAVAYMAFTDVPGPTERIFDLGYDNMFFPASFYEYSSLYSVYSLRFSAESDRFEIIKDGKIISAQNLESSTATSDKTSLSNCYIGKSNADGSGYLNANLVGLYIYDRYLSDSEVAGVSDYLTLIGAASPTANPSFRPTPFPTLEPTDSPISSPTKTPTAEPTLEPTLSPSSDPTAKPTYFIEAPPGLISSTLPPSTNSDPVPSGWVVGLDSGLLSDMLNNDALDNWGVYSAYGSPIYHSSGGGNEGFSPYVSFHRSSSQYIDLGSLSLAVNSNGGLTAVAYMAFSGEPGDSERIFDIGQTESRLSLGREAGESTLLAIAGGSPISTTSSSSSEGKVLSQGTFSVLTWQYESASKLVQISKDGSLVASKILSSEITDLKSLSNCYLGKSNSAGDAYLNGNVVGLYIYDRKLSTSELSSLASYLKAIGSETFKPLKSGDTSSVIPSAPAPGDSSEPIPLSGSNPPQDGVNAVPRDPPVYAHCEARAKPRQGRCGLQCQEGLAMSSIDFASFGTPSVVTPGDAPVYAIGECHAESSQHVASKACLGRGSCSITATAHVFGDPCIGVEKRLYIRALCT